MTLNHAYPKRMQIQRKAYRYRIVVTIETDTELSQPLDQVHLDALDLSTVTKTVVPAEGDTIAHRFPDVAMSGPENPFSIVAELNEV